MKNKPSSEGMRRYPPDGIYKGDIHDDPSYWRSCICRQSCQDPCKGECGCAACHMAYADFLSGE